MPSISFDEVSVSFEETRVLDSFSLTLSEQRIGIIGENGSGKSTLARLINGLTAPTSGTVSIDGQDVQRHGAEIRRRVGFIFSDADNQIVMPRVRDDLEFSLRRHRLPRAEREERIRHTLRRFSLDNLSDHSPHLLSGGQKQLLALASILVVEPEIIIADEPTTLLDLRHRRRIAREFEQLPQQLIVVTHDLDLVANFDRIICIDRHAIIADGPPAEVIPAYVSLMEARA